MIVTFGNWRLVPYDERNWALEHFHAPRTNNPRASSAPKWNRRGEYFQTVGAALRRVLELEARADGGDLSLAEAAERFERIADNLAAAVAEPRPMERERAD